MLRNSKNLIRSFVVYGLGSALQKVVSLFLLPFFTSVLSPEDYGIIALLSLLSIALAGLLNLGTGNSLGVLYFAETNRGIKLKLISTNIITLILNTAVWYFIVYENASYISYLMFGTLHYDIYVKISVLGTVFGIVSDPLLAYLRMEHKAKYYVLYTFGNAIFTTLLSIWLVFFEHYGLTGMILAPTLSQGAFLIVNLFIVNKKMGFEYDFKRAAQLIKIGFPSTFGLMAFLIVDFSDRAMIEYFLGLGEVGVYSIGYSIGMLMMLPVNAFGTAWPPYFMAYLNKVRVARVLFGRVLELYIFFFGIMTILFFTFAVQFVRLFTQDQFFDASSVVGLVAAAYALKGCYLILLAGIYFEKKLYIQSIIELFIASINILLNWALIPILGISGAAIATFVSYSVLVMTTFFVSRRYLEVLYDGKKIFSCICYIIMTVLVVVLLDHYYEKSFYSSLLLKLSAVLSFTIFFTKYFLGRDSKMIKYMEMMK